VSCQKLRFNLPCIFLRNYENNDRIRKPGFELHRLARNICYYMTKDSRAIITPSSPLWRTWLMEHFNRLTAIMINDVDSCDPHSQSVWLRNSIPTFKLVFLSLYHYDRSVTLHAKLRSHKLRDFTFPKFACCW
jgi:hypothetical protein